MPLPDRLARFNRRVSNPIMRTYAGRVPGLAIVEHRGRKTGRVHRTPVNAFRTSDGFAIALTYGPDRDWVRNVWQEGGCTLVRHGRRIALHEPEIIEGTALLPGLVRAALRVLGVREVLRLKGTAPGEEKPG